MASVGPLGRGVHTPDNQQRIRVLVVDDHPVVRFGLAGLLAGQADLEVAGEADSCAGACLAIATCHPDVLLLDLGLEDACGAGALSAIRDRYPELQVIVFTAHEQEDVVLAAVSIGLHGYLVKGTAPDNILLAIRTVARGGVFIDPRIAAKVLGRVGRLVERGAPLSTALTDKERHVLRLVAQGKRNKDISETLFISERTVKFHMSAILRKLHASNRTEVVRIAATRGLVSL